MVHVGVKELKNDLSRYLRLVARGEHVRVTSRGKPVADLVPATRGEADERWRRLVAEGQITPATKPLPERLPPLEKPGELSPGEIILADRAAER